MPEVIIAENKDPIRSARPRLTGKDSLPAIVILSSCTLLLLGAAFLIFLKGMNGQKHYVPAQETVNASLHSTPGL